MLFACSTLWGKYKKRDPDSLPDLLQRALLQKVWGLGGFSFYGVFLVGWLFFLKVKKQTQVVFVSSKVEALAKPPRMPLLPSACMTISFVSSVPKKTFPLVLGNC